MSVTGCKTKETVTKVSSEPSVSQCSQEVTSEPTVLEELLVSTEGVEIEKAHKERELFVVEDEPMTFSLGGEKIKVKDSKDRANAILSVEWMNSQQIAVECHVNPSLDCFTVYDVQKKKFTYEAYGYDFVWKDGDIKTVVYIEAPPHCSKKGGTYAIKNYDEEVVYQSKDELMTLGFDENGDITFEVMKEDGSVENKMIEDMN